MSSAKAEAFIQKGEKKLKGWFGGSGKYEEAAEFFEKAANLYKMSKKWEEAGSAYKRVSDAQIQAKSSHEAATALVSAAGCYKRTNVSLAISCLRDAIEIYCDEGRFSAAAKQQKEIGELCEKELDFEGAIDQYREAADLFEGEEQQSSANGCLLKVALFSAQLERYRDAIEIYERVASKSIDNNLLKWSCKDYFFRAGLCHLALADLVGAQRAVDKYDDMDATFASSREGKFLREIIEAVENYDVTAFTNAVVEFDSISKLDSWKTSILLKVKNQIKGAQGEEDEEDNDNDNDDDDDDKSKEKLDGDSDEEDVHGLT